LQRATWLYKYLVQFLKYGDLSDLLVKNCQFFLPFFESFRSQLSLKNLSNDMHQRFGEQISFTKPKIKTVWF